ncbi:uncharacterized protein MKK02DRAFT_37767 [Dioszegia hungarica]|uniref:Uncharacterized protein n=1 Tax=Dioszegia hungarica TaxID=4972 RepID=A0AA38H5H2_9TREE|nr:uncharacterized protein MKK02DRAFT_37767 [Dioszegia hungarica]KAI9634892.1 hypothetical protein MKK02DRAFT_37767 [Dioszegia hungarica]
MPPPILSSPFLTHSVLDTLLSQPASAQDRINLLSAKIHLYANEPTPGAATGQASSSTPSSSPTSAAPSSVTQIDAAGARSGGLGRDERRIPEMRTRLDLAEVQLNEARQTGESGGYTQQADAALRIVLDWTRGAMKGIERRRKERSGGREEGNPADVNKSGSLSPAVGLGGATEEDATGWESELRAMRRRALGMAIQVEEALGRTGRIVGLGKQLVEEESMQSGS